MAAYEGWFQAFGEFCDGKGYDAFPAELEAVEHFLVWMLAGEKAYAVGTVRVAISAILVCHRWRGAELPENRVWDMVRGAEATMARPPNRKAPLTWDLLLRLQPWVGVRLVDVRDWAMLLLGFHAALRKMALLCLDVCDLLFDATDGAVEVTILRDKNDPMGLLPPRCVDVVNGSPEMCAVTAVHRYMQMAGLRRSQRCSKQRLRTARCVECGPLWRQVAGSMSGGIACMKAVGANGIKSALVRLLRQLDDPSFPPSRYSALSLRRGSITELAAANVEEKLRMAHAGHKTVEANRGYVEEDWRRRRVASRGLQEGLWRALSSGRG